MAGSNQRPSEVLASLLEFCLPGEEGTVFFRAAFTMRLPVAIQAHQSGTELTNQKELAQMADHMWLCHAPKRWRPSRSRRTSRRRMAVMLSLPWRPRSGPTSNRASPKASRPLEKAARARASAGCIRSLERTATDVPTRRTAPGWETRRLGGGGCCLLWPKRLTSPVGGRGITAAVPGQHRQLLFYHPSQVQRATIWAVFVHS